MTQDQNQKKVRVSYSQLNRWINCPNHHRIVSVDKLHRDPPNEYTAFGSALHSLSEVILRERDLESKSVYLDVFVDLYREEIKDLNLTEDKKTTHIKTAIKFIENFVPLLVNHLGDFEVKFIEKKIDHPMEINGFEFDFVGYVDFILVKDDNVYIFDLKTANKKWSKSKKTDRKYLNQLYSYKFFISKELGVPYERIKTKYVFVYPDSDMDVLDIESSEKDIQTMLNDVKNMVLNAWVIKNYPRNPMCEYCFCRSFEKMEKKSV